MKLRWMIALSLSSLCCMPARVAQADALAAIPKEAVGFVCIPNPSEFDSDVKRMIESLGFGGMVPLPNNSVLQMMQAQLPAMKDMDQGSPLIVSIMPGDDVTQMNDTQVLMIPTKDPKAMLETLGSEETDGQLSVSIMNKTLAADTTDNYVLLADRPEILEEVEGSKGTMQSLVAAPVAKGMENLDLVIGLNVAALSDVVKPWLEDNLFPMMQAQANTAVEKESMELNEENLRNLIDGVNTVLVGLRMEEGGIAMRVVFDVIEGSEFAETVHVAVTKDSLLAGLPNENWALAAGQIIDKESIAAQRKNLDQMFSVYENADGVNKEKLTDFRESLGRWLDISRGYRMSISPASESSEGVVDMTMIATSTDSKEWMKLTQETFDKGKAMAADIDEDELTEALAAISMKSKGDEMIIGFDLSEISDIDDDQKDVIENLMGSEIALRMKTLNDKEVLITMGGGAARLAAIAGGSSSGNPEDLKGIKELAAFLPAERNSVTYIFVDQCIELARKVLVAIDEDDLPFITPEIDTPIAIVGSGGDDWTSADIVIPMEVIEAGRDIGMTMMGQQ